MSDKNGRHPCNTQSVRRALRERHYNERFYPKTLIGDDDELLENLKSTGGQEEVVPDLGKPAAVLRAFHPAQRGRA